MNKYFHSWKYCIRVTKDKNAMENYGGVFLVDENARNINLEHSPVSLENRHAMPMLALF